MRSTRGMSLPWTSRLTGVLLALLTFSSHAADATPAKAALNQHFGVATCAGSSCHGSTRPFEDSTVRQDEYFIWQQKDAHHNAYKLLQSPAAKRIAINLGLKDATLAPECLTCHTDFVPEAQRGKRYAMNDGVGCEACHGGSEKWLGAHVSGTSHAENVAQGMTPLEDPLVRAKLCLDCHQGSAAKPVTHRMMGAGHPPLEFDLEFYTSIQPAHFRIDADYKKRKTYAPGGQVWAVGQLVAGQTLLDGMTGDRMTQKGLTPELVFFDCNSCHHPMRPPVWNAGVGGHQEPGQLRIADSSLVMSAVILRTLKTPTSAAWDSSLQKLHRSSEDSVASIKSAAADLRKLTGAGLTELKGRTFTRADLLKLMDALATEGDQKLAGDLTAAKQIYYGLDSLNRNLQQDMQMPKTVFAKGMDDLFAAVDVSGAHPYDPEKFRAAVKQIKAAVATQAS
jgi:hypothetical protein